MDVLGYLPKLKTVLYALFMHIFCMVFHKNVPYLTLYSLTEFQCHVFFRSQDIKQSVLY